MPQKKKLKDASDNAAFDDKLTDPAKLKKETLKDFGIEADPVTGIQSASDHYMRESKRLALISRAKEFKYLGHNVFIFNDMGKFFFKIDGPEIRTESCSASCLTDAERKARTVLDLKVKQ